MAFRFWVGDFSAFVYGETFDVLDFVRNSVVARGYYCGEVEPNA